MKILVRLLVATTAALTASGGSFAQGQAPADPRPQVPASAGPVRPLVVDITPARTVRTFRPDEVLGAAFDGAEAGDIDRQLTARNIAAMKRADLRALSYRLRTELGINAWHWNPVGSWSDPGRRQGYWTSSDALGAPIRMSWGYRLPRRGDTNDNANNNDYSRLTDGDRSTFWKSNPYLDPTVLRDGEAHPQWLVIRLDEARPIDHAVIDWGEPFATRYEVQYWSGANEYDPAGRWVTFPHGAVTRGAGGHADLSLGERPVFARFLRVLLEEGSGTAPAGARDWRDRMGFAVREVAFGVRLANGAFSDAVVHSPSHDQQTFTHVSSTDPWHRATDRNRDLEQAGLDRIFDSRLGFGLPVMIPTGLLFDTPENAAAELRYIAKRHYPVRQIELGEEPDGQYGAPADYAALYLKAADRLKGIVPGAVFGGPSLQSAFTDVLLQPEKPDSWNRGFMDYLRKRDRLDALGFLTFEYYPFDDICGDIHAKLIEQQDWLEKVMRRFDEDGAPRSVPRIISEYGFSAYSGRAMSEMPGALLMASIVGQWMQLGGGAAYMFGYPPNTPINQHQSCAGYGNMMLFMADAEGQAGTPMPTYHAARLLSQRWAQPGGGLHRLLATEIAGSPEKAVAAYALQRPDRTLSVLLINRSPDVTFRLSLFARRGTSDRTPLQGPGQVFSYGPDQYQWLDNGPDSRPLRSLPPAGQMIGGGPVVVTLKPDTLQVVTLPDRE